MLFLHQLAHLPFALAMQDSGDDSEDNSGDSSDDLATGGAGKLKGRARWLKRTTVVKEKVEKDKVCRSKECKHAKEEAARACTAAGGCQSKRRR